MPLPVNGSGQPLLPPEMIQKTRKHTPVSPSLVAYDEMSPLESADRHTAPSQKLLTSKQPTSHAAPALAPSLSSDLITHSPQSLNLVSQNLLDRTQTGDSNLVANTTVDSSHEEKVPRQQGQDIDRPLSLLPLPVNGCGKPLLSPERMQKTRKHTPASPSLVRF